MTAPVLPSWELTARERIRDTLALYTWSGDAFRLTDLASAFCEDGVLEVRGRPPVQGRDAIVAFLDGSTGPGGEAGDDEARRTALKAAADASGARRMEEFRLHAGARSRTGVADEELDELLFQVAAYCGAPAGIAARRALQEVRAQGNDG